MPSSSAGRSFFTSGAIWDVRKPCSRQISRRTAASVSAKVGLFLRYQAAVATARRAWRLSRAARSVTRENSPSRQGVVRDRLVRPLALGLDAEVVTHFPEGDFHLPALDEPGEDLQRIASEVGAEEGLWVEAALGVSEEHPADRHGGPPSMVPNGGGGVDLDGALA